MADEPRQWSFGSPAGGGGASGGADGGDQDQQPEEKKDKSLREKAEDAKEKIDDTRRGVKRAKEGVKKIKEAPEKIRKGVDKTRKAVKKTGDALKKGGQLAKKGGKAVAEGAKRGGQAALKGAQTAGKGAAQGGRVAAQATARAAHATAQMAIRAAQVTARMAIEAAKIAVKLAQVLVKLLMNPYVLAAVILIVLLVLLIMSFMGAVNNVSSLAGGSIFIPARHSDSVHREIVKNLQDKMQGCDPRLVVYADGRSDLGWQTDADTGKVSHKLDIRLLKTLDYLTDKHRIKIDLLNTGAPDLLRESFVSKLGKYNPEGWEDKDEMVETLSAFYTGQAMAITEIDRSEVLPPADIVCNVLVPPPIQVNWQETVMEKAIRPLWEEMSFVVGYLDRKAPILADISARNDRIALLCLARTYLNAREEGGSFDLYNEVFQKIQRIQELVVRAQDLADAHPRLFDSRTTVYLTIANRNFSELASRFGDMEGIQDEDQIADYIAAVGQPGPLRLMRAGTELIYKAVQVANMVNWAEGKQKHKLAYESRNKIRTVIKELLEMPRETSLSGELKEFDQDLMVKQIITFSPEDALGVGLERADVFPWGIIGVGVGGVELVLKDGDEGDGELDNFDSHFSHAPIDNGAFSQHGTNYIYKLAHPEDSFWEKTGALMFKTSIAGNLKSMHDLAAGGVVTDLNEVAKKITYKDFLHVAF